MQAPFDHTTELAEIEVPSLTAEEEKKVTEKYLNAMQQNGYNIPESEGKCQMMKRANVTSTNQENKGAAVKKAINTCAAGSTTNAIGSHDAPISLDSDDDEVICLSSQPPKAKVLKRQLDQAKLEAAAEAQIKATNEAIQMALGKPAKKKLCVAVPNATGEKTRPVAIPTTNAKQVEKARPVAKRPHDLWAEKAIPLGVPNPASKPFQETRPVAVPNIAPRPVEPKKPIAKPTIPPRPVQEKQTVAQPNSTARTVEQIRCASGPNTVAMSVVQKNPVPQPNTTARTVEQIRCASGPNTVAMPVVKKNRVAQPNTTARTIEQTRCAAGPNTEAMPVVQKNRVAQPNILPRPVEHNKPAAGPVNQPRHIAPAHVNQVHNIYQQPPQQINNHHQPQVQPQQAPQFPLHPYALPFEQNQPWQLQWRQPAQQPWQQQWQQPPQQQPYHQNPQLQYQQRQMQQYILQQEQKLYSKQQFKQ